MKILGRQVQLSPDDVVYHGDAVTIAPGFDRIEITECHAQRFEASIKAGLRLLESGRSEYARDVRPIAGAAVETFHYFDADTGKHVVAWRVACREHSH